MPLQALYNIKLDAPQNPMQRQSVNANETRINENFRRITEQLAELYAENVQLRSRILELEGKNNGN
jgi:hypothetical protein